MIKFLIATLYGLLVFTNLKAQSLAAFHNNANNFIVFEDGIRKKLEFLPVTKIKVGADKVGYIDNTGNFKVYYGGKTYILEEMAVENYRNSNGFFAYKVAGITKVFEGGETQVIVVRSSKVDINDSIIAFYDLNRSMFAVYVDGKTVDLENIYASYDGFNNFKTGRNLVAYFTPIGDFKVFYKNRVHELLYNVNSVDFKTGKSIVAYIDPVSKEFRAFYDGNTYVLEYIVPKSYQVGDERIAYVDNLGNFKCFSQGEVSTILSFEPNYYKLNQGILLFNNQQRLNVYYNNNIMQLEYYFPGEDAHQIVNNRLAYLDQMGGVKLFEKGQTTQVTATRVLSFDLNPHTLSYRVFNNTHKVLYKGHHF